MGSLAADTHAAPSSDEILARVEGENKRRHLVLKEYSGWRQYTLHNLRFGKQAAVAVLDGLPPGGRRTLHRVDAIRLGQAQRHHRSGAGVRGRSQRTAGGCPSPDHSANYRVRLLGIEVAAGRSCYVLELAPRIKSPFLIVGQSLGGCRELRRGTDGRPVRGQHLHINWRAPHQRRIRRGDGFWLPGHVRSVTSSFLLGPTQLEILFSNYQVDRESTPQQ